MCFYKYYNYLTGYSLIEKPVFALPFEVLEGITSGLLVASSFIYAAKLATRHNTATFQGVLATVHYGFGNNSIFFFEKLEISHLYQFLYFLLY